MHIWIDIGDKLNKYPVTQNMREIIQSSICFSVEGEVEQVFKEFMSKIELNF